MDLSRTVHIAIGSNLGERLENLRSAITAINQKIGMVTTVSPVYQSPAWGFKGNSFLNACIALRTRFSPERILKELLEIETASGRKRNRGAGYENRILDLDLLLVEGVVIDSEDLRLPHPEMENRKFVMLPLNDIAAQQEHPVKKVKIREITDSMAEDSSPIERIPETLSVPKGPDFSKYNYIAVEGNIGAGKTSFATMASEDFNAKLILERFKDNPFLPQFYKDQARYAFPLEMSFLADRYQQLSDDIAQYDLFTDFVISDYDVFKSLIFAKITLEEDEYFLYQKLFDIMYKDLVKPDLYLYLYQKPERLLENIRKRGREYEQNIKQEYLISINESYLNFIKSRQSLNVIIIDISEMDFVNNREDYLRVLGEFT